MDLGATVCLPRKPSCLLCPVNDLCAARREGAPEHYPGQDAQAAAQRAVALDAAGARCRRARVWLEKRPRAAIWAGLYCLPVFDSRDELLEAALPRRARDRAADAAAFLHVLTHKDLHLHPVSAAATRAAGEALDAKPALVCRRQWPALGLPAPVRQAARQPQCG